MYDLLLRLVEEAGEGETMKGLLWKRLRHQRLVSEIVVDEVCAKDLEEELFTWLKIRGEHDACSTVSVRSTCGDKRGLFAKRNIKAGECILRVSLQTMMTPDRLPGEFQELLPEGASESAKLALLLLFEKRAGKASVWAPYISCLPTWGTIHSTAFWRRDELALIKDSALNYETMHRRATMRDEFAALEQIFQKYELAFGGCVTYASFKHAYVTVCSRAWRVAGLNKLAMIPLADFLNHDFSSNAILAYNSATGHAELFADRNYTEGEQLCINYGPLPNACLALDFGFTVSYNPWDKVELWLCISGRDPLRKEKLQQLHSFGMETLRNPDGSDTGGMSFTIREVLSVTGKGSEFPPSLLTMARVICTNSVEDLPSCDASQHGTNEAEARAFLVCRVEALIQQHIKSILGFEAQKRSAAPGNTVLLCLEMAEAVLGGELRVLRSFNAWLKYHVSV